VNVTTSALGSENITVAGEVVADLPSKKVVAVSENEHVKVMKDTSTKEIKETDPPTPGQPDKMSPTDSVSSSKSDPPGSHPQVESGAGAKTVPGASSVKTANTVTVVSSASQAGQTTWQKLSNRIKALERNVTLSTGFLEELSLKYIKQIEELNSAVKVANDAIGGVVKREEIARERGDQLAAQVDQLSNSLEQLTVRVGELQEEVLARHGLLLLLEVLVIGLVFLLCRPGGGRAGGGRSVGSLTVDRRRSLDTIKGEREKVNAKPEKRRSSIEVGCLPNGQVGSMVSEVVGLSKKQRKRKRRRDSRLGLRNVVEEEESDDSKAAAVYETFHGAEQRVMVEHRKRSRSWSEQQEVDHMESSMTSTSPTQEVVVTPSRFAVDQVWEQEEFRQIHPGYVQDNVFGYETCSVITGGRGRWGKDQYVVYDDASPQPSLSSHSPNTCTSHRRVPILSSNILQASSTMPPYTPFTQSKAEPPKSVWFPGRSRKGSVIKVSNGQPVNGHPMMEVSNMYTMLDHSVHETSACETEGEEGDRDKRRLGGRVVMSNTKQQKTGRSKSSSPNRQANLLMRRQREAIRKFQPEQAEWLHKKRDS